LGVDGGGTRSTGLIADLSGNILSTHEVGATNPNVVGFETSARHLHQLITKCCEDVRCDPQDLRSIVLGLAGVRVPEFRMRIVDEVNEQFVKRGSHPLSVSVETDARVALEGAFDGEPGVVLIAGTGSIIMGKTGRGDVTSVGGWGRILGDEGSGYAIGREGIRAVTFAYDGRGDNTKLTDLLTRKYEWGSKEDIIKVVYQEGFEISQVAPLVMEAAVDNDVVCQKILQNAAGQLVDQLRVVVMRMGILKKIPVVLSGGLVETGSVFRNVLQIKIMKVLPQVEVRQPKHPPGYGAVRMAIVRITQM
jgi:N-acetylglucosamine kinase-like BadF-type ATPase